MGIRRNATTITRRLHDQIRSALLNKRDTTETETPRDGGETGTNVSTSAGNLFHCSRCRIVYIAAEKRRCSQCDGDVEEVRSTLACRGP
ncbi:hypothetical protein E2L06_12790 [Haloterrigena sp. H1]|uniref:hypothetical protein n=1 Tax=Haloterrigena sp. H1 TaxID=2552943 RepID=UPI00110D2715|nr:hypothetical protein [Haloterrigena sp. H1]TMT87412.1 hypothetical protein E2L06_12790 [Haloterrigena sp. H1]